ncbi:MAG: 3-ketoacyl-ACP reductase [Devosiaceae bacterium]
MSKVALITGGQRGIGFGIAKALIDAGFSVAITAPLNPESDEVTGALKELGQSAQFFQHDVRDVETHASLICDVECSLGPIASFISNAGVPAPVRGDMLDVEPDNFDFVMDVNLRGAFFLAQAVARGMINQPSANYQSMVFISSVSAAMVSTARAEYCISKSAVAMMADLFAVRLAPSGIGVFEVRPGIIETPMTAGVKDTYTARIEDGLVPAERWGQPQDIASIVLPLVRGDMAFATGSTINADGGLAISRL